MRLYFGQQPVKASNVSCGPSRGEAVARTNGKPFASSRINTCSRAVLQPDCLSSRQPGTARMRRTGATQHASGLVSVSRVRHREDRSRRRRKSEPVRVRFSALRWGRLRADGLLRQPGAAGATNRTLCREASCDFQKRRTFIVKYSDSFFS